MYPVDKKLMKYNQRHTTINQYTVTNQHQLLSTSTMTTKIEINAKYVSQWKDFCKNSLIKEINVTENSDLHRFSSNMFRELIKIYNEDINKYEIICKFLSKGISFTAVLIEQKVFEFFSDVMKHEKPNNYQKQYKALFKEFRNKVQREKIIKELHDRMEELHDSKQALVHVETKTNETNEKQYAIDKNRTEIAHQQEIRLLKNEIERLKEQRDKEIVSSSLKDSVINTKDTLIMQQLDTIKQLQGDKIFFQKLVNELTSN